MHINDPSWHETVYSVSACFLMRHEDKLNKFNDID